jgi:hypothetical protein
LKRIAQVFQKVAQTVSKAKKAKISTTKLYLKGQNIYNKALFESPKHLHQTTFETLQYLQQTMFRNC